ncbi:hypothetical protein CHS0354_041041 [Potamilus streckersoni]|uniref:Mannosyltransferase n=1 Tax=Potamilus streckersoni TaxID=2493646 RepID=A0AAE0SDP0_9BIVA|nr:hypothetical protein CHS0354_041041 [Potamilus streckersoni]
MCDMRCFDTTNILLGALSICTLIAYTMIDDCFISRELVSICPTKSQFGKRLKANSLDEIPIDLEYKEKSPSDGEVRIPMIMHQFWNQKQKKMKSVINIDSSWKYEVWTSKKINELVHERFKDIAPFYDGYITEKFREEAVRYMILFEFGGVYADAGWRILLPLDKILRTFACFLCQIWHEESILDFHIPRLLSDSLMGCRKGHPFMRVLIENLPSFYYMPAWAPASTGLYYVSFHYKHYMADNDNLSSIDDDGVHLLPPEYFFRSIPNNTYSEMKTKCEIHELSSVQKWACSSIYSTGFNRQVSNYSVAVLT